MIEVTRSFMNFNSDLTKESFANNKLHFLKDSSRTSMDHIRDVH